MKVSHFEFLFKGKWVRLQGSGGQLGNGALHVDFSPELLTRVKRRLLAKAKLQLERESKARIYHYNPDGRDRYEHVSARPEDVTDVRAKLNWFAAI